MEINCLTQLNINNTKQWVLIRGKNINLPLLIHVQAGPGLPIIPEADTLQKLFNFEDKFLVVYWDQRGCGKSFYKDIPQNTINLYQLSGDIATLTQLLINKFNKSKAVIIGYSIGATLTLTAASKYSSLFSKIFLVGTDVDIKQANLFAVLNALEKAKRINNFKSVKLLEQLKGIPITNAKLFQKRAKVIADLGGINTASTFSKLALSSIKNMLLSKHYSLFDIVKAINGMNFCQNALLPEMDALNLFLQTGSFNTPIHFIHGKLDGIAPYDTALSYYNQLDSDNKVFTTFHNSAHMPHYEEPDRFYEVITENWKTL